MEIKTIKFDYTSYGSLEELSKEDKIAVDFARKACENSYSPYSDFKVGSVVVFNDGEMISGANQESEVFPSTMCAERVLLYHIMSNFAMKKVITLVIYGNSSSIPCSPCGACRQVIDDLQKRQNSVIRVIMCSNRSAILVENSNDLLPFSFSM